MEKDDIRVNIPKNYMKNDAKSIDVFERTNTELEVDMLESEIKWTLETIADITKAAEVDGNICDIT